MNAKVSEEYITSIFNVECLYPEDGSSAFFRKVGNLQQVYTALQAQQTTLDFFTAVRTSRWMTSVAENMRHTLPEKGLTEREIICFGKHVDI
jgi:hypothetical protein